MWEKIIRPFVAVYHWWKKLSLRWKGRISIVLPLTAVLISSLFAFFGNNRRSEIQSDIERKFAIVSNFNEVLTLMVNAETGMRGYQLTKKDEFLQPYQLAQNDLPNKIASLQSLIDAEPGEKPRLEKQEIFGQIKGLIEKQMTDLEWQKNHLNQIDQFDEELYGHITRGKSYMDEIRLKLGTFQQKEQSRLIERLEEIDSVRQRDYFFIFVTLSLALITRFTSWYLLRNGVHSRVARMLKKLKESRKGDAYELKEIGEMEVLEEEVDHLIEKYENRENIPQLFEESLKNS